MTSIVNMPSTTFNDFGDNHEHSVPIEPVEASTEVLKAIKDLLLDQANPLGDSSDVDQWLQDRGLSTTDEMVGAGVQEVADLFRQFNFDLSQDTFILDLQIKTSGSCDDPKSISISIVNSFMNTPVKSVSFKVFGTIEIGISINVTIAKGNTHQVHCDDSEEYLIWWPLWEEYLERKGAYDNTMNEWRLALNEYIESVREGIPSEMPRMPDLPPPWTLVPPPPPRKAYRTFQTFYVYWDVTLTIHVGARVSTVSRVQTQTFSIGGPCCSVK